MDLRSIVRHVSSKRQSYKTLTHLCGWQGLDDPESADAPGFLPLYAAAHDSTAQDFEEVFKVVRNLFGILFNYYNLPGGACTLLAANMCFAN